MNKKGVTLMELLVVLALLSIVSLSLFTIFRTATESYSKGDARTQAYQNARAALEMMSKEIAAMKVDFVGVNNEAYCIGYDNGGIKTPRKSSSDQLFFIAPVNGEIKRMGYWLEHNPPNTNNLLMRVSNALRTSENIYDFTTGTTSSQLALHIADLQFRYWDGSWHDSWNSQGNGLLPFAVEITLEATDEKEQESNTFSTVVYLPNAE